jgi:hypothetical protein
MARATARWRATGWGELLSEFPGTLVRIAFGDGVVAMAAAARSQSGRGTEFEAARHIIRGPLGGAADSTPTFSILAPSTPLATSGRGSLHG